MPTGYTAGVADGKITEFRDFAMACARAFGAPITMRDEDANATIPLAFEPSTYHQERLTKAQEELRELLSLTPEQAELRSFKDYEKIMKRRRRYNEENSLQRERYEQMLAKVMAWQPPSPDHEGLKSFMASQLADSINFDCSHVWNEPNRLTGEAWRANRIAKAEHDIEFHVREWQDEVKRTEERNLWLSQLRESFKI